MAVQMQNGKQNGERRTGAIERFSVIATRWIGSVPSLFAHTLLFAGAFFLVSMGFDFDRMLLALTTIVSLEAIYLAIFIQMTINRSAQELEEVGMDIEEISENVEEISENVEDIQEDVEGISVAEEEGPTESEKLGKIEQSLLTIVREIDEIKKKAS
ncbi:MAG: hypothetical protein Q8Q36_01120 [bacterium]|nr:hypothetical protein [bacterium]